MPLLAIVTVLWIPSKPYPVGSFLLHLPFVTAVIRSPVSHTGSWQMRLFGGIPQLPGCVFNLYRTCREGTYPTVGCQTIVCRGLSRAPCPTRHPGGGSGHPGVLALLTVPLYTHAYIVARGYFAAGGSDLYIILPEFGTFPVYNYGKKQVSPI